MKKQQLRKLFIEKRQQLSVVEYDGLNRKLLLQFQQLDFSNVHCIHLFLPISERKEPDTFMLREWLKTAHPDIKIVFPKTDFDNRAMQSFADDEALELAVNALGITEPVTGTRVNTHEIDLLLVPLLAFDRQGYRVAYRKGFYDRFMAQCKPGTQFIGLSFFEPVEVIKDVNEFDVRMSVCLTPMAKWIWH